MKKIALFLLGILALCSCSKFPLNSLVGVWSISSINRYDYKFDTQSKSSANYKTITFKRGGVGYAGDNPFNYTLDGDQLRIIYKDGTKWDCTIESLSSRSLYFFYEESVRYFGGTGTYLVRYDYALERVE